MFFPGQGNFRCCNGRALFNVYVVVVGYRPPPWRAAAVLICTGSTAVVEVCPLSKGLGGQKQVQIMTKNGETTMYNSVYFHSRDKEDLPPFVSSLVFGKFALLHLWNHATVFISNEDFDAPPGGRSPRVISWYASNCSAWLDG